MWSVCAVHASILQLITVVELSNSIIHTRMHTHTHTHTHTNLHTAQA